MKHVHWIGTGLSSIPGIRRLAKNLDNFTVWNRTLDKATKSIDHVDKNNVNAKQFDVDYYLTKQIQVILLFLNYQQTNI